MTRRLLRVLIPIVLVVAVFIGFQFSQIDNIKKVLNQTKVIINDQIIVADVAKDAATREKGLSGRKSIGINEGMLFIFENEDYHTFWMKGMNFPIDIIWISGDEIVGVSKNVQHESGVSREELKIYEPPAPVDKVLEIKAGRSTILDASEGDKVEFEPLVPNALKIMSSLNYIMDDIINNIKN